MTMATLHVGLQPTSSGLGDAEKQTEQLTGQQNIETRI